MEIRVFVLGLAAVEAVSLEQLVEKVDEDIGDAWAGNVGLFQNFSDDADPGARMDSWRRTQRIPIEWSLGVTSDRIDRDLIDSQVAEVFDLPV